MRTLFFIDNPMPSRLPGRWCLARSSRSATRIAAIALAAVLVLRGADTTWVDFENDMDLAAVRATTANVALTIEYDSAHVRSGRASLQLAVSDLGAGRETWPTIDVTLPHAVDLATVQAIECWVHVPEALSRFFFGRYDARMTINGRKPLWSRPALQPGWTHLRWELRNLYTFPETRSLRLQFGPIMPGFGQGRLHVDQLVFVPMDPLADAAPTALASVTADRAAPWTSRFQAIRRIEGVGGTAELPALFAASADGAADEGFNPTSADVQPAYILNPTQGSEAVRSAARCSTTSTTSARPP